MNSINDKDIKIDSLEIGTPYMLRNDGVLLDCGKLHPTTSTFQKKDLQKFIDKGFEYHLIDWFIESTKNKSTKDKLIELKRCKDPDKVRKLVDELTALTNQEFCRVRMSNIRWWGFTRDIYFRITSVGFDWSDLIWKVVYEYRDQIESVTICQEVNSFAVEKVYYLSDGTPIDKLPTEEFIMAEGKITRFPNNSLFNRLRGLK